MTFRLIRPVLLLISALAFAAVHAGVATAQHAQGVLLDERQTECGLCHGSHGGTPSLYNLKVDDIRIWVRPSMSGEPTAVSYSCMRCHAGAQMRERQVEFAGHSDAVRRGRYLGFDLSTHHPVGQISEEQRYRRRATGVTTRSDGLMLRADQTDVIECTACHDPHDRSGGMLGEQGEQALCADCHDPAVFQHSHEGLTCSSCHKLHDSHVTSLVSGGLPGAVCRSCHFGAGTYTVRRRGGNDPTMAHLDDPSVAQRDCTACHAIHALDP